MRKIYHFAPVFLCLVAIVLSLASSPLLAQGATGTITGTIRDATGAVLPGVEVTVGNLDTGQSRLAISGDEGRYSALSLVTGNYEVRAELAGFQTGVRTGIRLLVGQEAVVDFTMEIGSITEEVVVSGEAPLVNTTNSTISAVISETQVHELPLNSRDLTQLTLLTPGVVQLKNISTGGVTSGAPAVRVSVGGARFYQTGFFLDGTDVTDSSRGMGPGGAAGSMFGVETIKEFRVITNNYSAEYSRFSGGIMSMVTKSGTNSFHGSLFYFHRNDNFDATNFFSNKFDLGKPEFRRHQYGATIGGPIVADKTFFFFSYEGFREGLGISDVDIVPTADAKNGIFPASDIPTGRGCNAFRAGLGGVYDPGTDRCILPINPDARPFLALYDDPNRSSVDGLTADQALNSTQPTTEDFFTVRLDHTFSDSDSFFARYTTSQGDKNQALDGGSHQIYALTTTGNNNHYSTLEWKHIFSPSTINTFRFGAQRNEWTQVPTNPGPLDIGFYSDRAMGAISPDIVARTGINVDGQNISNQFSYANDIFMTRGRHDIKVGFLASRHQTNDQTLGRGGGQFFWDSIEEFVASTAFRWRGRNPQDEPRRGVRQTVLGFYIQDDFKWSPTFTMNLGLRYEPTVALTEVNDRLVNIRGNPQTATTWTFGDPYFEDPSNLNFAPRIGFAWDPFGDGKTSVRAGYGVFHITILPFHFSNQIRRSPPLSVAPDFRNSRCGGCVSRDFPSPPSEAIDPPIGVVAFQIAEYQPSQPYAQQWNFSLQRELPGGVILTGAYVGSRGTHLQAQRNTNARLGEILPDGRKLHRRSDPRPNTNFGDHDHWEFSTNSFYHGFNGGVRKRFADGLQFAIAYTYGRSIDSASRVNFGDIGENLGKFPQDQYNLATSNQGLSAHDVRNNFNFNFVWELPYQGSGAARHVLGGWQLNGILQLSTGNPQSLRIAGSGTFDWNRDNETSSLSGRPSLVPGNELNAVVDDGRNPDRYFDPTAFTLPDPGFNGNIGRNVIIGPGISTFDFSLFKNIDVAEEVNLQFRAEFFNIFNRTNFGNFDNRVIARATTTPNYPDPGSISCADFGSTGPAAGCNQLTSLTYRSTAGRITQTKTTNRQIQFGLRLVF